MTTAATSLLGLALPVTGELQGTWGDTVNNSITSLLDTAVAGTTTLSTDGDVTLTTTTLASNQARQAILLCSGARTALRTITAPAQSKIYTIINATTGGFSVKLVGVGPTTGLTIPNGASAVVAWNGSDFIEIGSSTVGNLTVNGNLTVTGTSTLTGAATLTANPTLSAGTANGVAYLNGSKVVTTGSALTFDGTNFGVGTTPPTGAGNYRAINAGAALMYGNTGSAVTALNMNGDINDKYIIAGAASSLVQSGGAFTFYNAASGSAGGAISYTQLMKLDSSGNLGLGVTPSAWNSVYKTFQLGAAASVSGRTDNNRLYIWSNVFVDSSGGIKYINSDYASYYKQQDGQHQWFYAASGTAGTTATFTQAMTLDASGRLLIGNTTNSNGEALQIDANGVGSTLYTALFRNTSTSTSVYNAVRFLQGASGSAIGYIGTGGSAVANAAFANNFVVGTQTANALVFNTNDTERARIDSSGNFYIEVAATTASAANMFLDTTTTPSGQVKRSTSALKYKQDIRDLEEYDIGTFRPVRYKSACDGDDQTVDHLGFIADWEDEAGHKELVSYGKDGEVEGFQYDRMTAILTKVVQQQNALIKELLGRVAALEAK